MIEDSLQTRKHVMHYDTELIPSESEVEEILRIGYSLSTSKQKSYPYKFYVLGPDEKRSKQLWNMAEGRKIDVDFDAYGTTIDDTIYFQNPGLFHLKSAPWTLIITPRLAPPNKYYKRAFESTGSKWQLENWEFVNTKNRESMGIEIGMVAKAITGAAMDRGWECSYNICFYNDRQKWNFLPYIYQNNKGFRPALMMTLGKGKKYLYQALSAQDQKDNTDPPFETIFEFVDRKDNEKL